MSPDEVQAVIDSLTEKMLMASQEMNYEQALVYRDKIAELKGLVK